MVPSWGSHGSRKLLDRWPNLPTQPIARRHDGTEVQASSTSIDRGSASAIVRMVSSRTAISDQAFHMASTGAWQCWWALNKTITCCGNYIFSFQHRYPLVPQSLAFFRMLMRKLHNTGAPTRSRVGPRGRQVQRRRLVERLGGDGKVRAHRRFESKARALTHLAVFHVFVLV